MSITKNKYLDTMESLVSPKFKSKVEQFYYDHQPEEQSQDTGQESLKIIKARTRAYSGDGRKSYFSFDSADIKSFKAERWNFNVLLMKSYKYYFFKYSVAPAWLLPRFIFFC